MRNFVYENPGGCRHTHVILTGHADHRLELIIHCFAFNLLLSSGLREALFASSKPSRIHRTGRTGRRSRGDWGRAPRNQAEETRLMMD